MGRIKSALEIALERTESVKGDKSTISQFEARQQGKKLANAFMAGEISSLESEINKTERETRVQIKEGMFDVLLAQVSLPVTEDDQKRTESAGKCLEQVIGDSRFSALFKQFLQLLNRYISELRRFDETIRTQYEPKLRQKEEELSRRLGTQVTLDPFKDAEFASVYNKNLSTLRGNYQTVVDQVREQARLLFNGEM